MRRSYAFSGQIQVIEHKGAILNLSDTTLKYQEEKLELTKNEFRSYEDYIMIILISQL